MTFLGCSFVSFMLPWIYKKPLLHLLKKLLNSILYWCNFFHFKLFTLKWCFSILLWHWSQCKLFAFFRYIFWKSLFWSHLFVWLRWYSVCLCFPFTFACVYSSILHWCDFFYLPNLSSYLSSCFFVAWSKAYSSDFFIWKQYWWVTLSYHAFLFPVFSWVISCPLCYSHMQVAPILLNDLTWYLFFSLSDIVSMHPSWKKIVWSTFLWGQKGYSSIRSYFCQSYTVN